MKQDVLVLVTETFDYDGGRSVTVYVPPDPPRAVVYAADGAWHTSALAEAVETSGVLRTMIVGVHGAPDDDARLQEYSPAFEPARFAAHEAFFVDDVRRWVQTRFGVALPTDRTAVWGASLGGELAIAAAIRHPDVFGTAFVASPGAGYRPPAAMPGALPRTYLVAGADEPFFLDNATRWADALRGAGADVVMVEQPGQHGGAFWMEEFPQMVTWAFG